MNGWAPILRCEFYDGKDGSEAEELKFIRDASGKVTGYIQFSV